MKRYTIHTNYLETICWVGDTIVDWGSAGTQYSLDGCVKQLHKYHHTLDFDKSVVSECGQYAFIYRVLGTKGLLLKNGELLREINRPYYYSNTYEYPVAFVTVNNKTYLIHCPVKYSRIEFEDVETGEMVTDLEERNPADFFHSRLEVSQDNTYLTSSGWFWHPRDEIKVFNIRKCFDNPTTLDNAEIYPNVGIDVSAASFISENRLLIGSSENEEAFDDDLIANLPQNHIAVWDLLTNQISNPVKMKSEFGTLFAIDEEYAWDIFDFPKIINTKSGDIVDKDESVFSGKQKSSIIIHLDIPKVAFNTKTKHLAIVNGDKIEIFTP